MVLVLSLSSLQALQDKGGGLKNKTVCLPQNFYQCMKRLFCFRSTDSLYLIKPKNSKISYYNCFNLIYNNFILHTQKETNLFCNINYYGGHIIDSRIDMWSTPDVYSEVTGGVLQWLILTLHTEYTNKV